MDNVTVIFLTYNGGDIFRQSIEMVKKQDFDGEVEILVVDSGSTDDTLDTAKKAGAKIVQIPNSEFHHSRTRNLAFTYASHGKLIFLVQDAIPSSTRWLSAFVRNLNGGIAASFACQLPHKDADAFAAFETVNFSDYMGDKPVVRSLESESEFNSLSYEKALYRIRHDNVSSIYTREVLEDCPFPDIDFAEDIAWAKSAMLKGYKTLYNPEVCVYHSHNRTPSYRFDRTIVSSVALSDIFVQVKNDISYLTLKDIIDIYTEVDKFKYSIADSIMHAGLDLKPPGLIRRIARLLRLKRIVFGLLNSTGIKKLKKFAFSWLYILTLRNHVNLVMGTCSEMFPDITNIELIECLEQILALLKADLVGDLYSSSKRNGTLNDDLEDFVKQFMHGV